jgi:hypothetical protein
MMSVIDQQIPISVALVVLGNPSAQITGVRIHDNRRDIWFSPYPEGEVVSCLQGTGAITVTFEVANAGDGAGSIFGQLTDSDGHSLINESINLEVNETHDFTATFDMPSHNLTLTVTAGHGTVPPSGQYGLSLQYFGVGGGYTDPPFGDYVQNAGTTLTVTAYDNGYDTFDHWELDGVNVGSNYSYTVTFDNDHILVAVFRLTGT